jgi:hypothetical protein
MIHSIRSHDAAPRANYSPAPHRSRRTQGNAQHVDASNSQSGSLDVTTAEGDKVSISFSAIQKLQADQVQVHTKRGDANAQSINQSSQLQVDVKVDGSLSDKEVSDIFNLLQSLAGNTAKASNTGTNSGVSAGSTAGSDVATATNATNAASDSGDSSASSDTTGSQNAPANFLSLSAYHYEYHLESSYQSSQVQFG